MPLGEPAGFQGIAARLCCPIHNLELYAMNLLPATLPAASLAGYLKGTAAELFFLQRQPNAGRTIISCPQFFCHAIHRT